ncbi:MAG TPA: asparaginase [Nitriliruptorales bacterium]|nr:asparaginase [Nitriliruptorales bacterium]
MSRPAAGAAPALLAETTRWLHGHGGRMRGPGAAADRGTGPAELVECRHVGHAVVVAPNGRVLVLGDPQRVTFARSAVKPFQAAASLELAGRDLPDRLVAVGWASHLAEPPHLSAVRELLEVAALSPDDLTTPAVGVSAGSEVATARLRHNCSGKHALFALAGKAVGCRGAALLDPDGPLQRHVLATVATATGPIAGVGVDGCGAPAVAIPLAGLARAFRDLARSDGRWSRGAAAGRAEPLMVGGTGRLETALLTRGVVAKPGAEGVFGAGWRDAHGGTWGAAIKVEDGAQRASSAALHALLADAGVVQAEVWQPPPVLGGGRPAGSVRAAGPVLGLAEQLRGVGLRC